MNPLRLRALAAPLRAAAARRTVPVAAPALRRTLVTPTSPPSAAVVSDKNVQVEEEAGE